MKVVPILVVLAVGAMLGRLSPDFAFIASPKQTSPSPSHDEAVAADLQNHRLDLAHQQQWYAGKVSLQRAGDGHFYADVTVDGATSNMLVDTGASVIALTGADATAIGVAWDPADLRQVATGAGGAVYGVPVTLENVEIGGLKLNAVEAVVVPKGPGVSLLGQSFLSRIDRVEIDRDTMVLGA